MKEKLRKLGLRLYIKYICPIRFRKEKKRLINKDFTIVSDNCWGARVYQEHGLPYCTPFVDLFIYSEDYLKLVKDLKGYLGQELVFVKNSRYIGEVNYPLALLGDVEVHFLHYSTEREALEKWTRRVQRVNYNNLFFKMNDSDGATRSLLYEFDRLPLENKIIFTAKAYPDLKHAVQLKSLSHQNEILNGQDMKIYRQYFDVESWLDSSL